MSTNALMLVILLFVNSTQLTLDGHVLAGDDHDLAFKANDGKTYPLFRSLTSEALFTDPRLRERELRLVGRMHPDKKGFFEVINIYSMKDGVAHEVFYWCEICHIRATAPGDCWCCFAPFELREVPVTH